MVRDRDLCGPTGGVYRIPVTLFDKKFYYIGQTCRTIDERINEHIKSISSKYGNTTLKLFLLENPDAVPHWKDTKILAAPSNHNELLTREALEILLLHNSLNGKFGSELSGIWRPLLEVE